uniref:Uncharacterized protein n=1 Tax=Daphnia galeata TaxID=27404 RepID=A0A8J2RY56_9CRUS|nr:unnamed protein product [Daphnia galeata]
MRSLTNISRESTDTKLVMSLLTTPNVLRPLIWPQVATQLRTPLMRNKVQTLELAISSVDADVPIADRHFNLSLMPLLLHWQYGHL